MAEQCPFCLKNRAVWIILEPTSERQMINPNDLNICCDNEKCRKELGVKIKMHPVIHIPIIIKLENASCLLTTEDIKIFRKLCREKKE